MKDRDYYLGQISAMFFALDGGLPVKPEVNWCIERTAKILDEIYDGSTSIKVGEENGEDEQTN
jgi:hypothetical protein